MTSPRCGMPAARGRAAQISGTQAVGRRAASFAAATLMVIALGGCAERPQAEVPVVPTPTPTETTEPTRSPSPTYTAGVPELCETLLGFNRAVQILEVPLDGGLSRLYNDDFLESSGRTGRLTCSYGTLPAAPGSTPVPSATPVPPPIEISVSAYSDEDTATRRVAATVDSVRTGGGHAAEQTVGGREGFLLDDGVEASFVLADGTRTYVVTLQHGVVTPAAGRVVLLGLAAEMLDGPAEPGPT